MTIMGMGYGSHGYAAMRRPFLLSCLCATDEQRQTIRRQSVIQSMAALRRMLRDMVCIARAVPRTWHLLRIPVL